GDQLMADNPALDGAGSVVMVESLAVLGRAPLHRIRAQLVLSAMRHHAAALRERGFEVEEIRGAGSFGKALEGVKGELVCAAPNRASARRELEELGVRFVPSNQFLTTPEEFAGWAQGRKAITMEPFYREQRRRYGILVEADGEPVGGRWTFAAENRTPPRAGVDAPAAWRPEEDEIDRAAREDLDSWDLELWGEAGPRLFAVTPEEAQAALADFVANRLPEFGAWQDAMVPGDPFLFHSLMSVPLNLGLIGPLEVARAAQEAFDAGKVPIEAAEGFIRQVIGWREYVWGMYWLRAGEWREDNALDATAPLPAAYWGEPAGWACLDSVVEGVARHGYANHIERLMVLGNIAMLAGIEPWAVVNWFERSFVDGAEWVMAPNAAGMALYADGGTMMTKPYAAGGNYIHKMSGGAFCADCRYSPKKRTGEDGCPLSALYWDFIGRNEERFASNHRMAMAVRSWNRFDPAEQAAISDRASLAREELAGLSPGDER
ncbi:MAG: cryptochrome/photolyase family protein, partial [Solirubrobacterales bacterium]